MVNGKLLKPDFPESRGILSGSNSTATKKLQLIFPRKLKLRPSGQKDKNLTVKSHQNSQVLKKAWFFDGPSQTWWAKRGNIGEIMRALIQRVKSARVSVGGKKISEIGPGLLIFLGVKEGDAEKDSQILAEKIANLRIMPDSQDKMNLSILDILRQSSGRSSEILVVSQFTLYADTNFGRRPSFIRAAKPEVAKDLYEKFVDKLKSFGIPVQIGKFGEYMEVELINDGPVTIMVET